LPEGAAGTYFATPQDLFDRVAFYAAKRRVTAEAHRKVADAHTYLHRIQQIVSVFHSLPKAIGIQRDSISSFTSI
jgi:spore maturation protein CgeB